MSESEAKAFQNTFNRWWYFLWSLGLTIAAIVTRDWVFVGLLLILLADEHSHLWRDGRL